MDEDRILTESDTKELKELRDKINEAFEFYCYDVYICNGEVYLGLDGESSSKDLLNVLKFVDEFKTKYGGLYDLKK